MQSSQIIILSDRGGERKKQNKIEKTCSECQDGLLNSGKYNFFYKNVFILKIRLIFKDNFFVTKTVATLIFENFAGTKGTITMPMHYSKQDWSQKIIKKEELCS